MPMRRPRCGVPIRVGKAQQGANHALGGLIEGEALQAGLIVQPALDQHLHQSDAEFGLAFGLFLDFGGSPGHQRDVIERHGALRVLEAADQGTLAQEIVSAENIDDRF